MDTKERGGAVKQPAQTSTKKWWESTGFFTSAILFFAGLWGINSADFDVTVRSAVMQIYTLVGAFAGIRLYIVNAKFDVRKWLSNPRAYEYLAAAFMGLGFSLPADSGTKLWDLVNAIKTGNIGIIIPAAISFAVFVWNVWKSQPAKAK